MRSATRGDPGHGVDDRLGRRRRPPQSPAARRSPRRPRRTCPPTRRRRRRWARPRGPPRPDGGRAQPGRAPGRAAAPRSPRPDEVGAGGSQAHHDDVGAGRHAQPLNGLSSTWRRWPALAGAFEHVGRLGRERGEHRRARPGPMSRTRVDAHRGVALGGGDRRLRGCGARPPGRPGTRSAWPWRRASGVRLVSSSTR